MAVNLLTPIPSSRTRSINFFNGRLLAGEDLTTEQQSNRAAHALLGQSIGDGVVYGFEVSVGANDPTAPTLKVTSGEAINRSGAVLSLENDIEVALARSANGTAATATPVFQDCEPPQAGPYVAGAGMYALTVGPASKPNGLAEVNGLSNIQAPCNTKYNEQGVQFRLIPILQNVTLPDQNHIRNFVAYQCFGVTDQTKFPTDPFNADLTSYGLMDQLRAGQSLTNCEVPLAVMYWTSDLGVAFVDMWSVRRQVFRQGAAGNWSPVTSARRATEGVAMFLQFQDQMDDLISASTVPTSIIAANYFQYLPPVGFFPIGNVTPNQGLDYLRFFAGSTFANPVFADDTHLRMLLQMSFALPPIDLSRLELIWLYQIRQNQQAIDNGTGAATSLYMVFANGHLPYQGNARFDLEYFNYANHARMC